ncbi:MAG: hypothetical protein AAB214_20810, partial [Fibrobacterota bacterium]
KLPLPDFSVTTGISTGAGRNAVSSFYAKLLGDRLMCQIPSSTTNGASILSIYGSDGSTIARYKLGASSSGIQSFDFSKAPVGRYFAVLQSDKSRQSSPFVKTQGDLR